MEGCSLDTSLEKDVEYSVVNILLQLKLVLLYRSITLNNLFGG